MNPPFRIAKLEERDGEHDRKENDCRGRASASVEGHESLLIDVIDEGVGGVDRAAPGHHIDDVEGLKGVENRRYEDKESDWRNIGRVTERKHQSAPAPSTRAAS